MATDVSSNVDNLSAAPDTGAELLVDLAALADNYRVLSGEAEGPLGAVVKANAYGLGVEACSQALWSAGCRAYFVATVEEGFALRTCLADAEIYVMAPPLVFDPNSLRAARLIPCIYSMQQLKNLAEAAPASLPAIALQIDTGMHRLGLPVADVVAAMQLAAAASIEVGMLMSHYACSDDRKAVANVDQQRAFAELQSTWPEIPVSLANTGGVLLQDRFSPGLSRAGIGLYGIDLHGGERLRTVATLRAPILQIRDVAEGEGVGYGHCFRPSRPSKVAVVGAGYADGIPRIWGEPEGCKSALWVRGQKVALAGRVSMDLTTIDVTDCPAARPGDWAQFFGAELCITEQAAAANTIGYDLLTAVGKRVRRTYCELS